VPRNVAVDSGPLVALLVAADENHRWAREQFALLRPPLLTCEPVLAETAFVIERLGGDPGKVLELMEKDVVHVGMSIQEQAGQLRILMRKYRDL
jgi:predicted nucleic acid-binding protein